MVWPSVSYTKSGLNGLFPAFVNFLYRMTLGGPATYLSRHEEQFEVSEKDILEEESIMAADTESHASSGSQYLQDVLGDVLADALSKVAKERPSDPIQFVANYLHSLKKTPAAPPVPEEPEDQPGSGLSPEEPEQAQEHFGEHVEPAEAETEGHQSRLEEYKVMQNFKNLTQSI